jgi:phosphate transport system protein
VITDLERIADHAVDIAKVAERLAGQKLVKPLVDIQQMALLAQEMVGSALSAFVAKDRERANNLAALDHDLDRLYRLTITEIEELMQQDPAAVPQGIQLLFASQAVERIGDHATNLGEWFIFLETGERTDLNQ